MTRYDEDLTRDDGSPEPDEPAEGDLVTYDHVNFFEAGSYSYFDVRLNHNLKLTVAEDEDMWEALDRYMDSARFWPNVWFISDHGNVQLLTKS